MGNFYQTKEEVRTYLFARIPLIIVRSSERERVERLLREISLEDNIPINYYTDTKQVTRLGGGPTLDVQSDPLLHITDTFLKNRKTIFAFGDINRVSDDNLYSREVLNLLYLARETDSTLLLITADSVWPRLAQFGMLTCLEYPDTDERKAQIEDFISRYSGRFSIDWGTHDINHAATLLRGFSEIQVENILNTTLIANRALDSSHLSQLTQQKSRLYAMQDSIQTVQVSDSNHVAGLGGVKQWLQEKREVFFAKDQELKHRALTPPKGILLAGVPGCGKSLSARMVARNWGLPLFRFDISSVYDKWVGESEKKMREALEYIDNVAPCVLWIDEIEKMLSVSAGGHETGNRVLGQFLFWLQESSSRVFLVATANNIEQLPVELFRKGRFSEIFFIDLPNRSERIETIDYYAQRSLHHRFTEEELLQLSEATKGFSYSDIEHAVKDLAELLITNKEQQVGMKELRGIIASVIPISQSRPEMITAIREWGRKRAVPASSERGGFY